MFVLPQECSNFQEWLDREIAAAEQGVKEARDAVWDVAKDQEEPLLQRTLTVYRTEAISNSLKDVRKALTVFENGGTP